MSSNEFVSDPGRLKSLSDQIRNGELTPTRLVKRYLERIREVEPQIQAWRDVYESEALEEARRREEEAEQGIFHSVLHGIPVGIKDIIDVEGDPTRAGSPARADASPATGDAELVSRLRCAGAIVLGKTHTTEFAYYHPAPTRNPHRLDHTPGGSSSGSGAAVASGMVPLALGTQTAGSVNRPAAYCGIGGFKPSQFSLGMSGIVPVAPSFDTAGFLGYRVEDALLPYRALAPAHDRFRPAGPGTNASLSITVLEDPLLDLATQEVNTATTQVAQRLSQTEHSVGHAASPIPFESMIEHHTTVMEYEISRHRHDLRNAPEDKISDTLRETIERGGATPRSRYLRSRRKLDQMQTTFWESAAGDLFLFPAAPEPAPASLETTGDPRFIVPWTCLGGPIVSMPAGFSPEGLPLSVLVAGRPGTDRHVVNRVTEIMSKGGKDTRQRGP